MEPDQIESVNRTDYLVCYGYIDPSDGIVAGCETVKGAELKDRIPEIFSDLRKGEILSLTITVKT